MQGRPRDRPSFAEVFWRRASRRAELGDRARRARAGLMVLGANPEFGPHQLTDNNRALATVGGGSGNTLNSTAQAKGEGASPGQVQDVTTIGPSISAMDPPGI
ncbi:hypothetical protein VTN49DRAFT_7911 [Thermomyces lanuginosus]|uniref:uncharacterized protein n=1 Tax=Thermomyces lanuginosus TaxID=5541 RepID=UPI00374243F3